MNKMIQKKDIYSDSVLLVFKTNNLIIKNNIFKFKLSNQKIIQIKT
jgi:hypothetical protein